MATVPINNSTLSSQTGPIGGPGATAASFGNAAGAEMLGSGLSNLGLGTMKLGNRMARNKEINDARLAAKGEKEKSDNDVNWVNESLAKLSRNYSEFMNDESNQDKLTLDKDFLKHSEATQKELLKGAVSPEASKQFSNQAYLATTRYLDVAAKQSVSNRVAYNFQSQVQQTNDLSIEAKNLYDSVGMPGLASAMVGSNMARAEAGIDKVFKPGTKSNAGLKANLYESIALAAAESDPEFAKKLANNRWIDQKQRDALIGHIDSVTESRNVGARVSFVQNYQSEIKSASRTGNLPAMRTEAEFKAFLGESSGTQAYAGYREDYNAIGIFAQYKSETDGWNANSTAQAYTALLDRLDSDPTNGALANALGLIQNHNAVRASNMQADRIGTLVNDHPVISKAYRRAHNPSIPDEQKQLALAEFYDLLEYYQKPAPVNENGDFLSPSELHHVVNHDQVSLMSKAEAKSWADIIQGSDSNNFNTKGAELESRFGDPRDSEKSNSRISDAFDDIVTLGGLHGSWGLALDNRADPRIQGYVEALRNKKGNTAEFVAGNKGGVTPEQYEAEFRTHGTWVEFREASASQGQRSERMNEYLEGIHTYAVSLVVNSGMSMSDAKDESFNLLLGGTQKVVKGINGNSLSIAVRRSEDYKEPRTDEDIELIKDAEGDFFMDMRESWNDINQNPTTKNFLSFVRRTDQYGVGMFPGVESFTTEDGQLEFLGKMIGHKGYFRRTRDGQGGTLWMQGDNGRDFELRDHNNKPFLIHWDKRIDAFPPPDFETDAMAQMQRTPVVVGVPGWRVSVPSAKDREDHKQRLLREYPLRRSVFDFPNQGITAMNNYRTLKDKAQTEKIPQPRKVLKFNAHGLKNFDPIAPPSIP